MRWKHVTGLKGEKMTIGFIGLGNMASAVIGGIIREKIAEPSDIVGWALTEATRERVKKEFGIQIAGSDKQVAELADIIVLAVKPVFLNDAAKDVVAGIKESGNGNKKIIYSVIAGKSIETLEKIFGKDSKIVRAMPNTPALVGEGCTGVCINDAITEEEKEEALKIFGSFGKAYLIPERLIDTVGAVSGSSPAFVFMFMEALADAAVAGGMPRAQAYKFAGQAVLGSAKLMLETGQHPGELKDMVCSPGGTTIEGVSVLEESGFRAAIIDAVAATIEKTKRL